MTRWGQADARIGTMMSELATCKMKDLGLNVGDMFAVMTDEFGQPVQYIQRTGSREFTLVTVKPDGHEHKITASGADIVPDERFILGVAGDIGLKQEEAEAGVLRLMNRCEAQKRKFKYRLHGLTFQQPQYAGLSGEGVVIVDTLTFSAAWARDDDYYVGEGGGGSKSASPARYRNFAAWLRSTGGHKPIEMSEVSLGTKWKRGVPQFTNGRHRFAVLRDMGYESLPISVDVYSQADIEQLYGAK